MLCNSWVNLLFICNKSDDTIFCQKETPSTRVSASSAFRAPQSPALQQSDIVSNAADWVSLWLCTARHTHMHTHTHSGWNSHTHNQHCHVQTEWCRAALARPGVVFSLHRCGCRLKRLVSPALWFPAQLVHMSFDGMPPSTGNSWAWEHTS